MMRFIVTILIVALILSGCSSLSESVAPCGVSSKLPDIGSIQNNRWTWNASLYRVSDNHTSIERIPNRASDWHVNVNSFIEPPFCNHCLMIGKPQIQPDGTIKVKVILSHPFPGQPQYTGFDVRGTIMFPATRHWECHEGGFATGIPPDLESPFDPPGIVPLYFSRSEDGGGQLLNADGFSMYLFPGLDIYPYLPITEYSKGKHAQGPDPDSTVNGYKLFTNDPERRMFQTTDTISRTYHIDPADGDFIFGYVVDASWVAPSKTPVTDPKTDFPFWANCEDPYILEFEQLEPFKTGTYYECPYTFVTRLKVLTHVQFEHVGFPGWLICPDIVPDPEKKWNDVATSETSTTYEKVGPGTYEFKLRISEGTFQAPPGQYLAVLFGITRYYNWPEDTYPIQLFCPPFVSFIMLEVVEGD